jgi:predicted transglutaminase-like cysteine proteinase
MKTLSNLALTCLLAVAGIQFSCASQNDGSADQRIADWHELIKNQLNASTQEKISAVNSFINAQIQYRSDMDGYGLVEYWATIQETLLAGTGDCEDYAIAKFQTLRMLGVPSEQLRLMHVVTNTKQQHLVLVFTGTERSRGFVLDNLTNEIIASARRKDLTPIYSFNEEWLWVGRSNNPLRAASTLTRWTDVQNRLVSAI